jgi:hypothetical protein
MYNSCFNDCSYFFFSSLSGLEALSVLRMPEFTGENTNLKAVSIVSIFKALEVLT